MSKRKKLLRRYIIFVTVITIGLVLYIILKSLDATKPRDPAEPVEGITQTLKRYVPPDYPRITFTDVAEKVGIDFTHFSGERASLLPEDMGSGAAWGDYDNDGDLDLYVVNLAGSITMTEEELKSTSGNKLYRNDKDENGSVTFVDVSSISGVDYKGYGMGTAWGDYDNDGDLDLYVTNYGPNVLYRNNGDGSFTDVTSVAGVGDDKFGAGATWGDYDNDGDLDLYVCNYVDFYYEGVDRNQTTTQYEAAVPFTLNPASYDPQPNLLYRNNGSTPGHGVIFTNVAKAAAVDNPKGRSLSATFCDFNQDGWLDLYVANDISQNGMFRNLGNGKFEDIGAESWAADYRGAMGIAIGDYDNDGDLDMFITHWIAQENALFSSFFNEFQGKSPDPMKFTDVADMVGLGEIALDFVGWGTDFFDYDNDGRLDLFVVNGHTFENKQNTKQLERMQNQLFWNKGEEGFFEVSEVSGQVFAKEIVGRGAAVGDYDNDGDVDIFIVAHGEKAMLLRNDGGNKNNWLKVRLKGTLSNRFGIGARLRIASNGNSQIREVGAGTSYLSQNSMEAEFGLGQSTSIELLEIIWPSGIKQTVENINTNQVIEVVEHSKLNTE